MSFTFRKFFPIAFFLMIFALAVRQCAYIDPDLWWHLQAGQDIVLSRTIPHTDIYSFTKAGSEWVTHEWLSEVLIYAIYRVLGWGGLIVGFSALITLALWIAYRRCDGRPYIAAIAVLLAAASSSPLMGVRPQMLTFLLASVFVALLGRFERDGRREALWWMVPMMLLWVNLHAGYAVGLGLMVLYLVSFALDRQWNLVRRLAPVLATCFAVVPLNPNGFRMFTYPFETLTSRAMAAYIEEWASPNFHDVMYLPLAALLLILSSTLALSPKRARRGEIFLLLVTGFGALRSARHIPIFTLISVPILAKHLWLLLTTRGWDRWFTRPDTTAVGFALILNFLFLVAPATVGVAQVWHFAVNQPAYEAKNYPVAAVDFLGAHQFPGPIYNRYGWGGYLIKRLYPAYRVYIDGRADVYGDAFMDEALNTYDGHTGWRDPLDRLDIRTVLVSPDAALASLLRDDVGWQRVYEDSQAVIFTRTKTAIVNKTPTAIITENVASSSNSPDGKQPSRK